MGLLHLRSQGLLYWYPAWLTLALTFALAGQWAVAENGTRAGAIDNRRALYVLVTGPYPDPLDIGWDAGITLIPAVRLAFGQINNRTDILQEYRLELVEDDSGCRFPSSIPTKVITSFVRSVYYTQERIVGIIGPACSDTTLAIAPLLSHPEISLIQIAPTATSPMIETLNYNTTFTMISSSLAYINSIVALMRHSNWTSVGTLFDELGANFKVTHKKFTEVIGHRTSYTSHMYDSKEQKLTYFPLKKLRESRTRVIIVFAGKGTVQKLLCLAYHLDMLYPQYQWIFSERSLGNFKANVSFEYEGELVECTEEKMAKASNGSILNGYILTSDDSTTLSVTNHNYSTYRQLYSQAFEKHWNEPKVRQIVKNFPSTEQKKLSKPSGKWENTYYDAAWALGYALDEVSKEYDLSNYKSGQPECTKMLISKLLGVKFTGATGQVNFNQTSKSVQTAIDVSQLSRTETGDLFEVNLANFSNNILHFYSNFSFISDTYDETPLRIHVSVGIIVILTTTLLTILTAMLQIGFIAWHYKRSVKAYSPNISHLIFSGCYLFAMATIVYTIQQSFELNRSILHTLYPVMCSTVMWCFLLGYSLVFGTVFVKVWRVFRLFKHFRNKSPGVLLSDSALVVAVIFFLFIDTIICISWNLFNPWELTQNKEQTEIIDKNPTVLVRSSCTCENLNYWIAAVAVYKGAIALLLVVFSILNRKIQRKHFSHTKKINILVYSLTMLGGVGFPLYFLLVNVNIYPPFIIFCTILLMAIVMCCLMLFLPPIIPIVKVKLGMEEEQKFSSHLRRKMSTMSMMSFLSNESGLESMANSF